MMDNYTYEPLLEGAIRLIKLNPGPGLSFSLQHYDLSSGTEVRYIALSYCWGDCKNTCDVRIGDRKLQVTQSLRSALERIDLDYREPEGDTLIWIDQICINQENVEERNQQVHQMWRIFSSAVHVYAWLGDDMDSGERSTSPLHWHFRCQNKYPYIPSVHLGSTGMLTSALSRSGWNDRRGFCVAEDLARDVMTLLDQPYFSRTWVVPEILQARRLTFLYGSRNCPEEELKSAVELLIRSGWKYDAQKLVKLNHILETRVTIDPTGAFGRRTSDCSVFLRALELLHETDCSDIRDRIFAALSIPSLNARKHISTLQPDYLLSRDELIVVVIAYFDKLKGPLEGTAELSRVLSRSLKLGDGTNMTSIYESNIAASVLSCTLPWSEHEPLITISGLEVGHPGPFLRYYLKRPPEV